MSVPSGGKQERNTSQSGRKCFLFRLIGPALCVIRDTHMFPAWAMSSRESCCIHFSVCKVGTGSPTVTVCVAAALVPR